MEPTSSSPQRQIPHPQEIHEERKSLKWFLGVLVFVLLISITTDVIFSFFNKPYIPKERNPFMTVQPSVTPTPFFKPDGSFSSGSATISPSPFVSTPIPTKPQITGTITQCTMDAKECPDGTFVGRSGPKCEFVACPKKN